MSGDRPGGWVPVIDHEALAVWLEGWCDHEGVSTGVKCCAWGDAAARVRRLGAAASHVPGEPPAPSSDAALLAQVRQIVDRTRETDDDDHPWAVLCSDALYEIADLLERQS